MRGKLKFAFTIIVVFTIGCRSTSKNQISIDHTSIPILADNVNESLKLQSANLAIELSDQRFDAGPLHEFNFNDPGNFLRLSLDQCIDNALRNSLVVRELGGTALRSPDLMITANDAALAYTDPVIGEEAALSEFDANFANQFAFQNNDRSFNSSFIGDQGRLDQKLATNTMSLSKRSATGTLFQVNNQILYDLNNTPANRFANNVAYDTFLETELRQPLLQGGGVLFNRIAGPNNRPGVNNGVLIARTNTDITLAEFELGIRNLVSEVENAYWDLYFAYRDLEAKVEARNGAYKIWESLKAQGQNKKTSEILQAEEQYYLFASRVKDAIHGQLNDGTRTFNGSSSGTFRGNAGVRTAERRLRLIAGYTVNDGLLIVPQDMPIEAQVVFDWEQVKTDALTKRTELRRQRWVLKREELNLIANKNFLLPRVDMFGKYRVRGFGNDLFGNSGFQPDVPPGVDAQNGTDAYRTFLNGDLQEWELGMDINIPIGYRRQWAAVRNTELAFTRQKKILQEQEREIVYGLSNSLGEVQRTSSLKEVNARRLDASKRQYTAIQEDFDNDDTTINLVLESQRRVIDAKLEYFRTQVEFMLAVKSVHFEKGTMLPYHNVTLTESGWTNDDYREAMKRENNKSNPINYSCPGLKISTPLDQPQIGFVGAEPLYVTRQKAKAKSDELFGNIDDDSSTGELAATDDTTAGEIAVETSTNGPTDDSKPDSVLLEIANQLEPDENPSEKSKDPLKPIAGIIQGKDHGLSPQANAVVPAAMMTSGQIGDTENPTTTQTTPTSVSTDSQESVAGAPGRIAEADTAMPRTTAIPDTQRPQSTQPGQTISSRTTRYTDPTQTRTASFNLTAAPTSSRKTPAMPAASTIRSTFSDAELSHNPQPNPTMTSSRLDDKTLAADSNPVSTEMRRTPATPTVQTKDSAVSSEPNSRRVQQPSTRPASDMLQPIQPSANQETRSSKLPSKASSVSNRR